MLRFLPNPSQKAIRGFAVFAMALCACFILGLVPLWFTLQQTYYKIRFHNQQTFYGITFWNSRVYLTREMEMLWLRVFVVTPPNPSHPLAHTFVPSKPAPHWELTWESNHAHAWRHPVNNIPPGHWRPRGWIFVDASSTAQPQTLSAFGIVIHVLALQIALFLILLFFLRLYRKNRFPLTHCQFCGYNLSGNPSASACPECGKARATLTPGTSNPSSPRI